MTTSGVTVSGTSSPGPWPSFGRVVALLLVAGLVATGARSFLVGSFVVPDTAMEPSFTVGDRVLVRRTSSGPDAVRRGDVVLVDGGGLPTFSASPPRSGLAVAGRTLAKALGAPVGESYRVRRVIGLPGERVTCCDATGKITVDGRPLDEPYLSHPSPAVVSPFDVRVPPGRLWLMEDVRDEPGDSRAHLGDPDGGTVPLGRVVGRVVSIWWQWGRATGIGSTDA